MPSPIAVSLQALGATASSGAGTAVDLLADSEGAGPLRKLLEVVLDVRAVSGTSPSLSVEIETSPDGTTWTTLRVLPTLSGVQRVESLAGGAQRYVRAKRTIGGTDSPSVTWSLTGRAAVVYCEPTDVTADAVPPQALEGISTDERWRACLAASDEADGYIGGAKQLPLRAWGSDLRSKVAAIVAAKLFTRRGCDPMGPDKLIVETNLRNATAWLDRLANGKLEPPGMIDSTDDRFEGGSVVVSSGSARGW